MPAEETPEAEEIAEAEETAEAEEIAEAEETAEAMEKLRTRQFNRTFFGEGQYKTLEQPSLLKLTKKSIVSQFPSLREGGVAESRGGR